MIAFLAKRWIKNYENIQDDKVRQAYGNLTSMVGIISNLFLCAGKFLAGTIAGSVSITADAVNNLTDAGSSMISLASFYLSSRPADEKHPFGHARYECIASMAVAVLVLFLGVELVKSSIDKLLHPQVITYSWLTMLILGGSIVVKLWMFLYNRRYGRLLRSSVMEATAADSLGDCMATGAVLLSALVSMLAGWQLDGWMGLVVAAIILWNGAGIVRSALDELLGKAPSTELVAALQQKITGYEGVLGMHDLMVHDYGVHRKFASVHVEVDYHVDVMRSHDMIDNIERDVKEQMGIELVIHMDPIKLDDPLTNELRTFMKQALAQLHTDLSLHDFRIVSGPTHNNVIFDVVVPHHVPISDEQILKSLREQTSKVYENCYLVITFDREYTTRVKEEA